MLNSVKKLRNVSRFFLLKIPWRKRPPANWSDHVNADTVEVTKSDTKNYLSSSSAQKDNKKKTLY